MKEAKERQRILGGVLKRIGNFNPKMTEKAAFDSRMIFQKTVYLLQAFGIDLGYSFSWYIHGPYSPSLAGDGYEMAPRFEGIRPVVFVNKNDERKFIKLLDFLGCESTSPEWLETAASIRFFRLCYPNLNKAQLLSKVQELKPHLKKEEFEPVYLRLKEYGLLDS